MSTNLIEGACYQNGCAYLRMGIAALSRGSGGIRPLMMVSTRGHQYSERAPLPLRRAVPDISIQRNGYFQITVFNPYIAMEKRLQAFDNENLERCRLTFGGDYTEVFQTNN